MIKHVFVFPLPVDDVAFYRWYYRFHSKECIRFFGPWLTRYEHYRGIEVPPEAGQRGAMRGGMTELWYRNVEDFIEAKPNSRPYTMQQRPPGQQPQQQEGAVQSAVTMVPAMPTEDFLGKEPTPEEVPIMRWYQAIKYPDGVSVEDGEKWYLEVHSQEAKEQPGLLRYVSHRTIDNCPFPTPWHRVNELWYEDVEAWREAVIGSPPKYTPPPWRKGEPFVDMASVFLRCKPTADYLRDNPLIP